MSRVFSDSDVTLVGEMCERRRSTGRCEDRRPLVLRFKIQVLPAEFAGHLSKSCSQWVIALEREVDNVLLPMVCKRFPTREANNYYEAAAKVISEHRLLAELESEERIERHIDQLLRRFFQLQAADDVLMHQGKACVARLGASIVSDNAREPPADV